MLHLFYYFQSPFTKVSVGFFKENYVKQSRQFQMYWKNAVDFCIPPKLSSQCLECTDTLLSCLIFMALDQSTLKLPWTNYVILSLVICTLYSTNKWKMNFIWNWSSRCIYCTCTLLVYGLEKQDVDIWFCYWK